MSKVKCRNCRFWFHTDTVKRRDRKYVVSFSFAYKTVEKGDCQNDACGAETSGYTGMTSGHKMSRLGNIERYCRFFEPKILQTVEGEKSG